MTEKGIAYDFLRKHNFLAEGIDFQKCVDSFVSEMELGLSGESSLPMIPTYLSIDDISIKNEKVIVIDAGGTNFRSAVMSFDENGRGTVNHFKLCRMPGTNGEIEADEFFRQMAEIIKPIIHESDKIGFCFSYALEMTPEKDGKILFLAKELKVRNAEGMLVGENLLKALGTPNKQVVLLNDTVAALLGGIAAYSDRKFSSYAGLILGTGVNAAYIEKMSNIKKEKEICKKDGTMIINMESGNFNKAPETDIDAVLASQTKHPESQKFEKMISGAYLGMNIHVVLKVASAEGLFSKQFSEMLDNHPTFEGKDISDFIRYPNDKGVISSICQNESEKRIVYFLAEQVLERAAKLTAISIAATVKKSGHGTNPLEPVCIIAEGSTFYKAPFVKERIACYIRKHLNDEMGLYADLLPADDVTLIGSAIAGIVGD